MSVSTNTRDSRLQEAAGFLCLIAGLLVWLSLLSYHPEDPSWNSAAVWSRPKNLIGPAGSYAADLLFQSFGALAFTFPILLILAGWNRLHAQPIEAPAARAAGCLLFVTSGCASLALGPDWRPFNTILPGGVLGRLIADLLVSAFNPTGAVIVALTALVLSFYLISTFSLAHAARWLRWPLKPFAPLATRWNVWRERRRRARAEKMKSGAKRKWAGPATESSPAVVEEDAAPCESEPATPAEIPIRTLEDLEPRLQPAFSSPPPPEPRRAHASRQRTEYAMPPTELLNEPAGRSAYDEQELKDIAARIKSKFEEFNVLGSVVQINPGPVVTTFEFKPEAGIKYSRITTLTEDLCLGLQAESILIERIPGKPTVGIEVPNSKREVISLRQILESEEFRNSHSHLTVPLGKDINGRIKVAALETMPHLLIAGSTGSGKSVMLNSMIMSILYKSTPDEVRMIMVDPKRLELGLYEGVPHLLTPVITDPRKATNALRNAVLEMERRLRLLASQGVRNIDQFNRKVRQIQQKPISLFEELEESVEDLQPLPNILVLIDELADLMMVEGQNVEQSICRLAQMARAVGMHLVLATQRPSVDVITGLIKANFPARISFRVATRVDSRTILDVMGAEHLLGKGDMLFLPPGSSRLLRVHGAFVTEAEINRVVEFWKQQAQPDYDQSYLIAPPSEDDEEVADEEFSGERDPLYEDAVRVVLEMGKASTSTLQRRLRLGYGRAARILDMMQREGIIGPPDGSKPREVLKRPDWLVEEVPR